MEEKAIAVNMDQKTIVTLTCITCRLTFNDNEIMRKHYKTDFHRFNLKRKVANLPPVPEELFNQKINDLQSKGEHCAPKGSHHLKKNKQHKLRQEKQTQAPQAKAQQSLPLPLQTKKSTPTEVTNTESVSTKTEEDMIDEKIAAAPVLTLKDSLFDRHRCQDFGSNLQYMTREFGFFIPEIEYMKDLPGLIRYLGQKISIGNTCIYCEKTFYSLDATRDHMRSVSHCKLLWEDNEEEYADFYDLEAANKRFGIVSVDGESENVYVSNTNELVLADKNKALGHRALQVYYKQRPHSAAQSQLITSLMQEHKRLAAIERQQNTNMSRKALNIKNEWRLKMGMQNNHQAHYRNQNPL